MSAEATPAGKPLWCTHCGKRFSRKEHLERHIPSHTNVKPWQCDKCFLGFTRKDLLSRHLSTYHEPKAPGDPAASGHLATSGRAPIACQNCASAKTGCNKEVPCERCKLKNLPCTPRFARRSAKVAARTLKVTGDFPGQTGQTGQTGQRTQSNPQPQLPSDSAAFGFDHHMLQSPHAHHTPADYSGFAQSLDGNLHTSAAAVMRGHASPGTVSGAFPLGTPDNGHFMSLDHLESNLQDLSHEYTNFYQGDDMFRYIGLDGRQDVPLNPYAPSEGSPSMGFLSTSSPLTPNTRGTSISSEFDLQLAHKPMEHKPLELRFDATAAQSSILEFEDVVKAEASWPLARCTRPLYSGTCPRTALTHLTFFERSSKGRGTWEPLEKYVREHVDWKDCDLTEVVPLKDYTRDSMLAITQKFLHKALEIHGSSGAKDGYGGFVVLPPSDIIHYFLRSYVRSLSVYYPLIVSGRVNPNEMLADCRPSTLLLLLMIAQGAAAMPVAEARYLSTGLTETCRISLFDIIEKNVELSADPVALRCALLFTLLGAWSGDKWLMDIAMGQRGMYMSMLKHAGMLESQPSKMLDLNGDTFKVQQAAWLSQESRNRLVYNWVMLDHELSLFHDTAPVLAITELNCPLPAPEALWMAGDADSWAAAMQSMYGIMSPHINPQMMSNQVQTPSLCELFQALFQNGLSNRYGDLTPQQMRLLLHPIQAMLCHLTQLRSCLPAAPGDQQTGISTVDRDSMQQRIQEVQSLLQQWYTLTEASAGKSTQCPLTRCNLVLYHLMYLTTVTNFPEIERLARREGLDDNFSFAQLKLPHLQGRCILQREEAILHCGQVLGLIRQMPRNRRPSWWTAAMYRAVLTLWADSITLSTSGNYHSGQLAEIKKGAMSRGGTGSYQPSLVPIDATGRDDPTVAACVWQHSGVPVLSRADGTAVGLDSPSEILDYGIKSVDDADSSRFGDGIRRKLATLSSNWRPETPWAIIEEPLVSDERAESWG